MADTFITYRSFNDKAFAVELFNKLKGEGIPVVWEDSERYFDVSFSYNEMLNMYYIKLRQDDFKKADDILSRLVKEDSGKISDDYYLYSFSDDELKDILKKPDEWNELDYYWANKILNERGIKITEETLVKEKTERINELRKPWNIDTIWKVCASLMLLISIRYLFILFIFGYVILGLYLSFSKKTLPGGLRVNAFSSGTRLFGNILLVISSIFSILIMLYVFEFIDLDLDWYY